MKLVKILKLGTFLQLKGDVLSLDVYKMYYKNAQI